jgi:hypothetical protein
LWACVGVSFWSKESATVPDFSSAFGQTGTGAVFLTWKVRFEVVCSDTADAPVLNETESGAGEE